MPVDLIDCIHKLSCHNGTTNGSTFTDWHHNGITNDENDDSEDDSYSPADNDLASDDDSIPGSAANLPESDNNSNDNNDNLPLDDFHQQDDGNTINTVPIVKANNNENNKTKLNNETNAEGDLVATEQLANTEDNLITTKQLTNTEDKLELQYSSRPDMRPRQPRKYAGRYNNTSSICKNGVVITIKHCDTKQYGIKKGIQIFGGRGTNGALLSELKQAINMDVIDPNIPLNSLPPNIKHLSNTLCF